MYLSILGKPTDEELVKYPSVHLTSIHEWDASVLDYNHPECDGEPFWANDPQTLIFLTVILIPMGCSKNLPEFNSDYLVGRTFLLPPGDNGERLRAKVTRKWLRSLKKQMGKESKASATFLALAMENWRKSSPITNLWTIWKQQPMRIMRSVMTYTSSEHSLATRGPSRQQIPIGKGANTMFLLIGRLGRRLMNLTQF